MKSVVVITPTTGDEKLITAMESVALQTYKNTKHLIVVDGGKFAIPMMDLALKHPDHFIPHSKRDIAHLPCNTGGGGFYGHRIYAGFGHLVNEDIICFLDQDNTYEPTHVEKLVETIEVDEKRLWAYSLRNIIDKDGKFLCKDDCESLGKWPVWTGMRGHEPNFHVDTSAYAFKREFLINVGYLWHTGYAGDRMFFHIIKTNFPEDTYACTGAYTLNYFLDGNPNSASPEFFTTGNEVVKMHYGMLRQEYPWKISQ